MSKISRSLHKDFQQKSKAIDSTRINFEKSFNASLITPNDIANAYAGLYLDLFTEFENIIEELFLGLLNGDVRPNDSSIKIKIKIKPITELESVMRGDSKKKYFDWLPYTDNTIPRANIYFVEGKPFTILTSQQKNKISNYHKIRNAIAHKSKKALKEFTDIISSSTLLPLERTPQGYLRNIPNIATGKTQLEIINDELGVIAYTLCYHQQPSTP